MPDGPKVGSITLSPRGDLRMPSDAHAALWLEQLDGIGSEKSKKTQQEGKRQTTSKRAK